MFDVDVIIGPQVRRNMPFLAVLYATILFFYKGDEEDVTAPWIMDLPGDSILSKYDFIIVGGGSAGLVLANRLTEIEHWSVLVIEAGGHENVLSDVPLLATHQRLSDIDWQCIPALRKEVSLNILPAYIVILP